MADKMVKIVISLTTIPPRFAYVCECLQSLLVQAADVAAINLYMPQGCKWFAYAESDLSRLPKGVNLRVVDEDLGPGMKILPACREYQGQDVYILCCDDDRICDPGWAQRFLNASKERPNCVICERGSHLSRPCYTDNSNWASRRCPRATPIRRRFSYKARRILSLGQWKSVKWLKSGCIDILEGWGGEW